MTELTPKERVRRLFRREPIDTMPCFSGMGMLTVQAVEQMGIRFAQVHTTAENMAGAALASARMFDFDALIVPFDMCTIPEALGRGVSLYENAEGILFPTVPTKWDDVAEVQLPADFMTRGRMPVVDAAFKILKREAGDTLPLGAWVLGPFTMAGQILELPRLMKGLHRDRQRIEELLVRMTDLVIEVARHYESLGADYITIREMGSGTDLISPRMWKNHIQSNLTRVFSAVDIPTVNHICGSTDMIIEMMNECGADAISVDHKNTLVETRKKIGTEVLLLGNFDAYGLLVQGEAAAVFPAIKQCIDDGVDAVWPGCDIWPDVKPENVEAYVRTVRENGRTATAAVGRL